MNTIIIQDGANGKWIRATRPIQILTTRDLTAIIPTLLQVEALSQQHNAYAIGFITYDAAPAFDPALTTNYLPATNNLPLLWFGIYDNVEILDSFPIGGTYYTHRWQQNEDKATYIDTIKRVKAYIASGDTYQVNYTLRAHTKFWGKPQALMADLTTAQNGRYSAFIETDDFAICSASPELFFTLHGNTITSKPMKGTAERGMTYVADELNRDWLRESVKNKAENVMIVDMIRNDMGRLAETGSVHVQKLFDVEKYPTLWQMTSKVSADLPPTPTPLTDTFRALFPCASITGAPKVRTMQIIRELESTPRGLYTGTIGFLAPDGRAQFNVAIRTAVIDKKTGQAEYGVGSGIIWDSDPADEYTECAIKSRVLIRHQPRFDIIETALWEPENGVFLRERHLARMMATARYFGYPLNTEELDDALNIATSGLTQTSKVRILLSKDGMFTIESPPITKLAEVPLIGFATRCIRSTNPFLFHKTTHREMYTRAKASRPDCDDVILWNERGEITEASSNNLVIKFGDEWFTPATESGLLPGTFRAHLLATNQIQERVIHKSELAKATKIWLINSVRGWREATLL